MMKENREPWTKTDFDVLVQMWIDGKTTAEIAGETGRTKAAVATYGSRIGLFGLTREELSEPGVFVRTCINPFEPHPFVSTGIHNRTCTACKNTQVFQAA
ncbi:hypothetical protein [Rhizobium leguminosarum]|uniref:hypothetical protein n=1 Tax=Rhizobium leguminosarum TaxID=384 RepID=UPI0015DACC05|nr:hypothetical protein [Rhizobium leguminosarum]NZD54180.1 hypothetical protein [Rhizobium leguminosarum]